MNPRMQSTSSAEIKSLMAIIERDLRQADLPGLHSDGIFGFLYNAALQLATILVRLEGERFGGAGHHRETIRRARDLVTDDLSSAIIVFETSRRKRNASVYDKVGVITQTDITNLREAIDSIKSWVQEQAKPWLDE